MAWGLLAASMVFAVLAVNAYRPIRREPANVVSFVLGWIPGELPLHVLAVEGAVVTGLVASGAVSSSSRSWPGWLGLAISLLSWAGLVGLTVVAHRSGRVVEKALAQATGAAITLVGDEGVPAWNRWWRLLVVIPFRFYGIRRFRNIDYWGDGDDRHKLDILVRRRVTAQRAPVFVYVHGGAWVIGDKRQQGIPLMHELAQRGWVCVAINYRLAPRAAWPAQIVDCKRALAWVREHIAEYGGDAGFIAVSGGSAGGQLASLAALTAKDAGWQPGFEDLDTSVDACVTSYGVYDMTGDRSGLGAYGTGALELLERSVMQATYADDPGLFESASPDRRITSMAPPMLVFQGSNDTLVAPMVARRFVERLRERSASPVVYVEFPRAQHAFDVLASIRCRHAVMGAVVFLERMRARSGQSGS
ncbi:MAG: alpha/beta hydrolase fold domain-containing protein [Acidimicrobiales bacterium]